MPPVSSSKAVEPAAGEVDAVAVGIDQVVADAEPAIERADVELRQQLVAGQDQLHLALLDPPPLLDQLGPAGDRLGQDFAPVELDAGQRRIVLRADQAAVGRGQAHAGAAARFRRRTGSRRAVSTCARKLKYCSRAWASAWTGSTPFGELVVDDSPGDQGAVAADLGRFQVAIGQVQVPVADLDVVEHVLQLGLQAHQLDVGADAGQDDRHAVDLRAAAAEQRMAGFDFAGSASRCC